MGRATGPFCCYHLQPSSVIAGDEIVSTIEKLGSLKFKLA